jgi:uncharacterized protein YigE (DUF2233 family)
MVRKSARFLVVPGAGWLVLLLAGHLAFETASVAGEFEGVVYHTLTVNPSQQKLRLFWRNEAGQPYKSFRALNEALRSKEEELVFATNAGIYQPGWIPEGLHIEEGQELVPLNLQGPPPRIPGKFTPNFYLMPNGVFYLLPDQRAGVMETSAYAAADLKPRLAVQSGPLLLASGQIHPVFDPASSSRLIRNGVGVDRQGRIHFVATDRSERGRVNFHTFARIFLALDCPNALYLDGDISEFYLKSKSSEIPFTTDFGAIFALSAPVAK